MKKYKVTYKGEVLGIFTIDEISKMTKINKNMVINMLKHNLPIREHFCTEYIEKEIEIGDKVKIKKEYKHLVDKYERNAIKEVKKIYTIGDNIRMIGFEDGSMYRADMLEKEIL